MKKQCIQLSMLLVLTHSPFIYAHIYKKRTHNIYLQATDYTRKPHTTVLHSENSITADELLSLGIRPVRIKIQNKSDKPITISRRSCSAPTISYKKAFKMLRRWQVVRPTLIFTPITAALQWIARYPLNGFPYALQTANMATKALFIARGLYTCILFTENEKLKVDLKEQCLFHKITIEPGDYAVDKIILLNEKEMNDAVFTLKIFDNAYTKNITQFKINLEHC